MSPSFIKNQPDFILSKPVCLTRMPQVCLAKTPKYLVDDGFYFALMSLVGNKVPAANLALNFDIIISMNRRLHKANIALIDWMKETIEIIEREKAELYADPIDESSSAKMPGVRDSNVSTEMPTHSDENTASPDSQNDDSYAVRNIAITDPQFIELMLGLIAEFEKLFDKPLGQSLSTRSLMEICRDYFIEKDATKENLLLGWFYDFQKLINNPDFGILIVAYNNKKMLRGLEPDWTASIEKTTEDPEKTRFVIDSLLKAKLTASYNIAAYKDWHPKSSIDELMAAIKKYRYFVVHGLFGVRIENGKPTDYRHCIVIIGASKAGAIENEKDRVYYLDPEKFIDNRGNENIQYMEFADFCDHVRLALLGYVDDHDEGAPYLLYHPIHKVPEPAAVRSVPRASATSVAAGAGRAATVLLGGSNSSKAAPSESNGNAL